MFWDLAQRLRQQRLGPAEDVRAVWAALAGALGELAQQAEREQWSPSPARGTPPGDNTRERAAGAEGGASQDTDGRPGSSAAEPDEDSGVSRAEPDQEGGHGARLEAVCEVAAQWGRSLVGGDLEGLQFLLMRLASAGQRWRRFAGRLDRLAAELQQVAFGVYGARLATRVSRLL